MRACVGLIPAGADTASTKLVATGSPAMSGSPVRTTLAGSRFFPTASVADPPALRTHCSGQGTTGRPRAAANRRWGRFGWLFCLRGSAWSCFLPHSPVRV
jgi:hypothetical protein